VGRHRTGTCSMRRTATLAHDRHPRAGTSPPRRRGRGRGRGRGEGQGAKDRHSRARGNPSPGRPHRGRPQASFPRTRESKGGRTARDPVPSPAQGEGGGRAGRAVLAGRRAPASAPLAESACCQAVQVIDSPPQCRGRLWRR